MKKNGFTLIELLVVMTIFAILMGLAMTSYQSARRAARDGRRKTDLEQIRSALEMCYADNPDTGYPVGIYDNITCGTKTYFSGTPKDPVYQTQYYYSRPTASTFELCAYLEVGVAGSCGTVSCGSQGTCNYKVTNP